MSVPHGHVKANFIDPGESTPPRGEVRFELLIPRGDATAIPPTFVSRRRLGVSLVSGQIGPMALPLGRYEVSFSLIGSALPSFVIDLEAKHTLEAPLNLRLAAPVDLLPHDKFVVNEQVYRDTLTASAAAAKSAGIATTASQAAGTSSATATERATAALAARDAATAAAASATASAETATSAKAGAVAARVATETAASGAASSATASAASATAAKTSETAAKAAETNARASETSAKTADTTAKASSTAAKTSETNSKTSETNAAASATAAQTARTGAETARDAAQAATFAGTTPAANTSLDTLTTPGMYRIAWGATVAQGGPFEGFYGSLEVQIRATGAVTQIARKHNALSADSSQFWQRTQTGGGWGAWFAYGAVLWEADATRGRTMKAWDPVNQRYSLIYGDSGWRDVSAALSVDGRWTTPAGAFSLRRVGHLVELAASSSTADGTGFPANTNILTLPTGFRPAQVINKIIAGGSSVHGVIVDTNGTVRVDTSQTALRWQFSFTTAEAWPTALPGTAKGTIPYA